MKRWLTAIFLAPIHAYRTWVSPMLPQRCKYHPSCSQYALDAVREVGVVRGSVLAAWRIARCNPWSKGGIDPIEHRRFFRAAAERPEGRALRGREPGVSA